MIVPVLLALLSNLVRLLFFPIRALRRRFAAPRGGYVLVAIDGRVDDLPKPPRALFARLLRPRRRALDVASVRALVRAIALDPRPRGVLVRIHSPLQAGPAAEASLRDALSEIRATGKDVVVHLPDGADTGALYVASAARLVVAGPETMLMPLGYAVEGRYVRRALDRVGVEPEVFAKGAYKSAGEELVLNSMSQPQREQIGAILEARHTELIAALTQGRSVDAETAKRWIDQAPHGARDALDAKIIDAIAYDDEFEAMLAPADTGELRTVPLRRYLAARRGTELRPLFGRPCIGVVEVHGAIVSRTPFGLAPVASEERVIAALRAARASTSVRGVILHVDSRGGSAVASNRIHHEVERLAEVKPVVAYLANVAASGGYYIASAAHAIVAQPQTITGSIGVVAARLVVGPLLERLGVSTDVVKRGARADLFSASRHFDEAERASFERELESVYRTFLGVVAKGRGRTIEEIEPMAGGRIYSGTDAKACGLLDHLGGLDRAIHEVRDRLGSFGKGLEPQIIVPPRHMPPPAGLPMQAAAVLDVLGLASIAEPLAAAVELRGERVLLYWFGA